MEITVAGGGIMAQAADTYVLDVAEGGGRTGSELAAVDKALGGAIAASIADGIVTEIGRAHV